jgi:Small-conductance mechanosensitive channel
MTASLSTKNQSAVVFDEAETSALSRWEALAADIAIATEESDAKQFNYGDATGNALARSWMAKLRKLKGRIEKARKEAKAPYLERGKAVDETAKTLEKAVQGLIDPHEREILAIEAQERVRIEAHSATLDRISKLAEGVTSSAEAHARLVELTAIDLTLLEEFRSAGLNRQAEAGARLKEVWDSLLIQEAEQAELAALRAEKAKQDMKLEALRIQNAERDAELEALRAERDRLVVVDTLEPERQLTKVQQAAPGEAVQSPAPAARIEVKASREPVSSEPEAHGDREAQVEELREQLWLLFKNIEPGEIIDLIVSDNLHEAIRVDWSKVEVEEICF